MFIKKVISFIFAHILLLGGVTTQIYVSPPSTETSTPSTIVEKNLGTTTKPAVKQSTTTPKNKETKTPIKTPSKPVSKAPEATTTQNQLVLQPVDFELINTYTRGSIINILCTTKGEELSPISGTGIVVTPSGLILTNAHVAEYLLLKDFREKDFVQCVARTGSPAYPKYNLELVYISPTWVANNKSLLKEQDPKGTGENDFAFLKITGNVNGSKLPDVISYVHMDVREIINKDEPVLLASYPAGFLGGISILQDLSITTAITSIKEIYTFGTNTVDLIAVPGTVVSQKGSSGGAVMDRFATLIGLISTSSNGDTTSERALNAITIAYINRSLQKEIGLNLEQFVSGDIENFAQTFQKVNVPNLTKLITDELNK